MNHPVDRIVAPAPQVDPQSPTIQVLRVATTTTSKNTSQAVEKRVVDYGGVKLQAVGAGSVNQAVKSIAIARKSLETVGRSLAVFHSFIHIAARDEAEEERSALQFFVYLSPPLQWGTFDARVNDPRLVRVSPKGESRTLASLIESRLNNDGLVRVQGVGPASVNQAVKSIAIAQRHLLEAFHLDTAAIPEFVHIAGLHPSDGERSALRWTLLPLSTWHRPVTSNGWRVDPDALSFQADKSAPKLQQLKVAATSDPKSVAGAITSRLHTGDPVCITLMGPTCVNQMVKALCIARGNLTENSLDIAAYVSFVHLSPDAHTERSALQTIVFLSPPHMLGGLTQEFKVSGHSDPKGVAGALANGIREGKLCKVESLGPASIGQAMKGLAIARANLEGDHIDFFFVPQFRTLFLSNGRRSALELTLVAVHE
eukprot:NODE_1915_length_1337_cov_26.410744_g1820_i0.p1 GENE.NODE_1915_length_1337_cov_26.410744_g1820_i0~~NODE_1915_length_1337_cov_26.410744_g1820_i0.p1  ORF type:complete len:441 (-),score=107.76 NODE_1915_length_1337_cov_26.410744_g1820_i0:14-1294(-)